MDAATTVLGRAAPAARTSVYVEGFSHKNPIPAGCRVGPLLESGSIQGNDPATGRPAETIEAQCRFMLDNVRRIVEAAGGGTQDIVKLTVWMKDRSQRPALNVPWLEMFPDARSRPARHAIIAPELDMGKLIECSFTAWIA
ncbi:MULTISPECIES: RidA family protein [unclassified Variovorax]|uniref:RidA family protein n=1 Tax=unclassified Variovorax TaxID=663243 RepID=UPI0025779F72|nr:MULTISPECIES: RidA family protein [unclassified Variovorax]MDM0089885.1 RidA family protein [Variovorax sp. J22G40]MDM0148449.1 RidA family protein [Variovorax sp. J2P1-31]